MAPPTTRTQTLSYVYDIIDIPEEIRTYLKDTEGIKTISVLASNSDAEWTGIVTRSNGTIKHFQKKYLQDFRDWYREYVNDNEGPPEDWEEDFTEEIWDRYIELGPASPTTTSGTPTTSTTGLPPPPTFQRTGRGRQGLTINTSPTTTTTTSTTLFPRHESPTAATLGSTTTEKLLPTTVKFDIKAYPKHDGKFSTWHNFKRKFTAVAMSHDISDLLLPEQEYVLPDNWKYVLHTLRRTRTYSQH